MGIDVDEMNSFKYTPDDDIKVHNEGAIRLLCKPYQSHENGLPEWLKNSADAYAREDAPVENRIILIILDSGRTKVKPSISCLDFSGMTSSDIEEYFRVWADPEAATHGAKSDWVQGGHGNGGKCYMTHMFEDHSYIHTVKEGRACRYGVEAGSIVFGYIPNREKGRNNPVDDIREELDRLLKPLRCKVDNLPAVGRNAASISDGLTLITGVQPKGYGNRLPVKQIIDDLQEHTQMITTLELCQVYLIANGKVQNDGEPLSLPEIIPMAGAEAPKILQIPELLKDPHSGKKIRTFDEDSEKPGELTLFTSKVSMRYKKKGRHNIIYKTSSGYIGNVPVTGLDVQSSYRDRIYGECYLESLEPFKQNDRGPLARTPLTRAIERFISDRVEEYARQFEEREKYEYDQEEKNALSRMNEALNQWKNRFLEDYMQGLWGPGTDGPPQRSRSLPVGKPARIDIRFTHHRAGLGISFRPSIKFFDSVGKHIAPKPYRWHSVDTNIALVDDDLLVVNTFSFGKTTIYAETLDKKITSNQLPLEVVDIREIAISPTSIELPIGSRSKLEAKCKLASGEEIAGVYLIWTESDPNIARVSSSGLVYGFRKGEVRIVAGDDRCMADDTALISVVEGVSSGKGDKRGRGFPEVLVSGKIDPDPETGEFIHLSKDDPPVYQRPVDVERNIWWINSSSPMARLYLNTNRGYGYKSQAWRLYHLERFIEIIVQIALTHGPRESALISVNEWIMSWGEEVAKIQEAAVSDLIEFLSQGELPQ